MIQSDSEAGGFLSGVHSPCSHYLPMTDMKFFWMSHWLKENPQNPKLKLPLSGFQSGTSNERASNLSAVWLMAKLEGDSTFIAEITEFLWKNLMDVTAYHC